MMWQMEPETVPDRPVSRVAVGAIAALVAIAGWLNAGQPYVGYYHAANTGVFLSASDTCGAVGFEFVGNPGFFVSSDC